MKFKMTHLDWDDSPVKYFTEDTAPDWLTSVNSVKGSTMDQRWFWEKHVLTLEVGESVKTDFNEITRIE